MTLDDTFDLSSPSAQAFLLSLVAALRELPEISPSSVTDLERFHAWLHDSGSANRPSIVLEDCGDAGLPLPRWNFTTCLGHWFELGGNSAECAAGDWSCGSELRFSADTHDVVGWLPRFKTSVAVTSEWDYEKIKPLWEKLDNFMSAQNAVAPVQIHSQCPRIWVAVYL
eukprot:SAG31_NODE_17212_length_679_cov_0.855172_2_plen_168_part_01